MDATQETTADSTAASTSHDDHHTGHRHHDAHRRGARLTLGAQLAIPSTVDALVAHRAEGSNGPVTTGGVAHQ